MVCPFFLILASRDLFPLPVHSRVKLASNKFCKVAKNKQYHRKRKTELFCNLHLGAPWCTLVHLTCTNLRTFYYTLNGFKKVSKILICRAKQARVRMLRWINPWPNKHVDGVGEFVI